MIFAFLRKNLKTQAVAVAFSMAWERAGVEAGGELGEDARERLTAFRGALYRCFASRADELFELAGSVLCGDGPVRTLAGLSLVPEHRRGHGALYDAVNAGRIGIGRLRWSLAVLPLPAWPDGRVRPAGGVRHRLRPGPRARPDRVVLHRHWGGRGE